MLDIFLGIQTSDGIKQVSEKYHGRDLVREDPISLFLPTMRDQGLCSYGLLYFLLRVQNTFLEEYCGRNDFQCVLVACFLLCFHVKINIFK